MFGAQRLEASPSPICRSSCSHAEEVIGKLQGMGRTHLLQLLRSQIGTNSPYGGVARNVSFWG
jgi:hypothetical protein